MARLVAILKIQVVSLARSLNWKSRTELRTFMRTSAASSSASASGISIPPVRNRNRGETSLSNKRAKAVSEPVWSSARKSAVLRSSKAVNPPISYHDDALQETIDCTAGHTISEWIHGLRFDRV